MNLPLRFILSVCLFTISFYSDTDVTYAQSNSDRTVNAKPNGKVKAQAAQESDEIFVCHSTKQALKKAREQLKALEELMLSVRTPILDLPKAPKYRRQEPLDYTKGRRWMDQVITNYGIDDYLFQNLVPSGSLIRFLEIGEEILDEGALARCDERSVSARLHDMVNIQLEFLDQERKLARESSYYESRARVSERTIELILERAGQGWRPAWLSIKSGFLAIRHALGKWGTAGALGAGSVLGGAALVMSYTEILSSIHGLVLIGIGYGYLDDYLEEAEISAYLGGLHEKYQAIQTEQDKLIEEIRDAWRLNCSCQ